MAAFCSRAFTNSLQRLLHNKKQPVVWRLSKRGSQCELSWCYVKYIHHQSLAPVCHQTNRNSRWQWLMLMASAGGFSHAFLGFKFWGKDDKDSKVKEDPLVQVFREAKYAQITRDFSKAETRFHDALKMAAQQWKDKRLDHRGHQLAQVNIFGSLGDLALSQGQLQKAEELYKETMRRCLELGLQPSDNAMVELSLKVASLYAMMQRPQEAESGLLYCIQTQDSKMAQAKALEGPDAAAEHTAEGNLSPVTTVQPSGDQNNSADQNNSNIANQNNSNITNQNNSNITVQNNSKFGNISDPFEMARNTEALLGMALETYGRFLMGARRLSEAVPVLQRAVGVAERVLEGKENQGQKLTVMNDLATAHIMQKQYTEAMAVLTPAISLASELKWPHLPVLYCNLGAVLLRQSQLQPAHDACLKGQQLAAQSKHVDALEMSRKCLDKVTQAKSRPSKTKAPAT